jgi:rhomboid protease GluP
MRRLVELSYVLTWMVGTSAVFGLATSLQQLRLGIRGWFYVNAAILLVLGLGVSARWNDVGYLALLLWFTFVILPNSARRRAEVAIRHQNVDMAATWAKIARALHPFDGQLEQARFFISQSRFDRGHLDAAKGILYPLLETQAWVEQAKMELLRLDGRWPLIVAHAKSQPVGTRDLRLAPLYLRAFGEVGDLETMWTMFAQIPSPLASQPWLRLQMASYSGLVDIVGLLLARHFSKLSPDYVDLVRATALLADGRQVEGEGLLKALVRTGARGAARASERLAHPPRLANVSALSPVVQRDIFDFERNIRDERPRLETLDEPGRAWVTLAIIVAQVSVFLVGLPQGTTDPENLVRLGALVIPFELAGGGVAWRIVAAGFLHLGATHLVMNCLGLWVLGGQIERLFGGLVMLAIFLVASVGSFGFAAMVVHATASEPRIFLGASSGVLGLVGALGTFLATGYLLYRRKAIGRRLLLVLAVVFAQLVFDWFTPMVSSMLHLTGLLIGAIAAVPFSVTTWRSQLSQRRNSAEQ